MDKRNLSNIENGFLLGVKVSGTTNVANYVVKKAKAIFSTKENSNIVPAT